MIHTLVNSLMRTTVALTFLPASLRKNQEIAATTEANKTFCLGLLGFGCTTEKADIGTQLLYHQNLPSAGITQIHKTRIEQRQTLVQQQHKHIYPLYQQHQYVHLLPFTQATTAPVILSRRHTQPGSLYTRFNRLRTQLSHIPSWKALQPLIQKFNIQSEIAGASTQLTRFSTKETKQNKINDSLSLLTRLNGAIANRYLQHVVPNMNKTLLTSFAWEWVNDNVLATLSPVVKDAERLRVSLSHLQRQSAHQQQAANEPTIVSRPLILNTLNTDTTHDASYRANRVQKLSASVTAIRYQLRNNKDSIQQYSAQYHTIRQFLPYQVSNLLNQNLTTGFSFNRHTTLNQNAILSQNSHLNQNHNLNQNNSLNQFTNHSLLPALVEHQRLKHQSIHSQKNGNNKAQGTNKLPALKALTGQWKESSSAIQALPLVHQKKPTPEQVSAQSANKVQSHTRTQPEPATPRVHQKKSTADTALNARHPLQQNRSQSADHGFSKQLTKKLADEVYQLINQKIRFEKRRRGLG